MESQLDPVSSDNRLLKVTARAVPGPSRLQGLRSAPDDRNPLSSTIIWTEFMDHRSSGMAKSNFAAREGAPQRVLSEGGCSWAWSFCRRLAAWDPRFGDFGVGPVRGQVVRVGMWEWGSRSRHQSSVPWWVKITNQQPAVVHSMPSQPILILIPTPVFIYLIRHNCHPSRVLFTFSSHTGSRHFDHSPNPVLPESPSFSSVYRSSIPSVSHLVPLL